MIMTDPASEPMMVEEARLWLVISPSSMSSSGVRVEGAGECAKTGIAGERRRGTRIERRGGGRGCGSLITLQSHMRAMNIPIMPMENPMMRRMTPEPIMVVVR